MTGKTEGPTPESAAARETERDRRLAALLEQLVDSSQSGHVPNWSDVVREDPELADELRSLWATAMIADGFGHPPPESAGAVRPVDNGTSGTAAEPPADEETPQAWPQRVGDYEILGEIGRGGMGVVFTARQLSLGRPVALKMILQGELAGTEDLVRFRREAESAARISHPNIVPVYEVGEHNGQPFFSMKHVEGATLADRVAEGPLSAREAAQLLLPVCRAVAEAHRHGMLHRDLKPSNILIDREGRPYVSDFGLAKRFEVHSAEEHALPESAGGRALTRTGAIIGTPEYMAPEQAAGRRPIDGTTDIYGLGGLLYVMLTGQPPHRAASPLDTLLLVLEQEPVPPRLLNRKVDPGVEMICLKCLQKPTQMRYQSADDLADDLQAYLADEPISARSSHFTQLLNRAFRETHHAPVLESWGMLWMLHSLVLLTLSVTTNWLEWQQITSRLPYLGLWVIGLGIWAAVFWYLRHRAGPTTFVERQIAHVWAGSMIAIGLLFAVEAALHLPVLSLSPVLGLISGMVFLIKAAILNGAFYIQSAALFLTGVLMAVMRSRDWPHVEITLFGIVSAVSFFLPGLKYYRQRRRARGSGDAAG